VTDNCYQNGDPSLLAQNVVTTNGLLRDQIPQPRHTRARSRFVTSPRRGPPGRGSEACSFTHCLGTCRPASSIRISRDPDHGELIWPPMPRLRARSAATWGQCHGAATCNANVTVALIPPETMYEDQPQQVDIRFTRTFRTGNSRIRGNFDVYNIFNASNVLRITDRWGSSWLNAVQIMGGRLMKVGVQVDF
jgi:hypothetical protein